MYQKNLSGEYYHYILHPVHVMKRALRYFFFSFWGGGGLRTTVFERKGLFLHLNTALYALYPQNLTSGQNPCCNTILVCLSLNTGMAALP